MPQVCVRDLVVDFSGLVSCASLFEQQHQLAFVWRLLLTSLNLAADLLSLSSSSRFHLSV